MALSEVPGTFTVGEADLMMGGAWPEQAWIQVRVDEDGNAMTHTEGDVSSPVLGPLGPGAEGIVIPLGGASN
jgi:hypothetical protein